MTHIITQPVRTRPRLYRSMPVECIVPGEPVGQWPWMYIDPDTCIDCGACIPECPYLAIFPEDEVPAAYTAKGGRIHQQGWPDRPFRRHQPPREESGIGYGQAAGRRRGGSTCRKTSSPTMISLNPVPATAAKDQDDGM